MPRCDNCTGTCSCTVTAGAGIRVTGAGSTSSPYVVEAEGAGADQTGVPPGFLMAYAGLTPPAGWLLCDGSTVSRGSYAALFEAVGTTWGSGDGASTFNLPDLRGKAVFGAGGKAGQVGSAGGAATVRLSTGQLPSHSHTINHDHPAVKTTSGGNHRHEYALRKTRKVESGSNVTAADDSTAKNNTAANGAHQHTVNVPGFSGRSGATGSGQAVPIMPPYVSAGWLIKT